MLKIYQIYRENYGCNTTWLVIEDSIESAVRLFANSRKYAIRNYNGKSDEHACFDLCNPAILENHRYQLDLFLESFSIDFVSNVERGIY